MYQRRNRKTGKPEGNWYISIAGTRESSGTTDRAKAKALEHKLNAEAWDRRHGFIVPVWEEACVTWIENNPVVAETYGAKKYLRFWKDHLAGKKLDAITPKVVHGIVCQQFKVNLIDPVGANATANGYVSMVGRVIRHSSNLNPKLTYYPKSSGRDRWLTVEEWHILAGRMNPDLQDISLFALMTGLREANIMGLQWSWVKGDWLLIPAEFTKTDKPYGIPLNRTAQAIVQRCREATVRHPELVFLNAGRPWNRVALCRALKRQVSAAGREAFTFHGFRHTFASWLAQKGVSHAIRARLGCWSTHSITDHYSHFDVDSLRPYAEMLDGILAANQSHQKVSA